MARFERDQRAGRPRQRQRHRGSSAGESPSASIYSKATLAVLGRRSRGRRSRSCCRSAGAGLFRADRAAAPPARSSSMNPSASSRPRPMIPARLVPRPGGRVPGARHGAAAGTAPPCGHPAPACPRPASLWPKREHVDLAFRQVHRDLADRLHRLGGEGAASCASRASRSTGKIVPVSLFAHMIEAMAVFGQRLRIGFHVEAAVLVDADDMDGDAARLLEMGEIRARRMLDRRRRSRCGPPASPAPTGARCCRPRCRSTCRRSHGRTMDPERRLQLRRAAASALPLRRRTRASTRHRRTVGEIGEHRPDHARTVGGGVVVEIDRGHRALLNDRG